MLKFIATRHNVELGTVNAVSYRQAMRRADTLFGRCELLPVGDKALDRVSHVSEARTHGRRPCATPGFEARRAALIAAYKAG